MRLQLDVDQRAGATARRAAGRAVPGTPDGYRFFRTGAAAARRNTSPTKCRPGMITWRTGPTTMLARNVPKDLDQVRIRC
jgi:hypothetical protein